MRWFMEVKIMNDDYMKKYISSDLYRLFDIVGEVLFQRIVEDYNGSQIYIPSKECYRRAKRNMRIYDEFCEGRSVKALAAKWNVSESCIRRIVKRVEEELNSK